MKRVFACFAVLGLLAAGMLGGCAEEEKTVQPELSETYSNVAIGGVHQVTANTDVVWTSADPAIATVENGLIMGVSVGTTTVTASVGDKTASLTVKVGGTLLAIGDSIFTTDFSPNMLDTIAEQLGYTLMRDTISGSTIVSRRDGASIIEHIDGGVYERFLGQIKPDVILIGRGTNDIYWNALLGGYEIGDVDSVKKEETCGAIRYALTYFRDRYPEARIAWSNSIWRRDVDMEKLDALNDKIARICATFKVEIVDLRKETGINADTADALLADGVHPNPAGQQRYIEVITRALRKDYLG